MKRKEFIPMQGVSKQIPAEIRNHFAARGVPGANSKHVADLDHIQVDPKGLRTVHAGV